MIDFNKQLEISKNYLSSHEALQSIERDPYWPKWNSPWWYMSLFSELGLASEIPKATVSKMVEVLKHHYLPIFPIHEHEIPVGIDPYRKIACFCAVGNMYQILFNSGVDVDQELPWMKEWFFKYQLPDGGLNCDEKAYTKEIPKSSIVTTIACLEAVLFCRSQELTSKEIDFLNKGASYLLHHKLFRRQSTGEVIDQNWLEIRFPRFYEYDFLRGYYFLAKWRQQSGFSIPDELTDEVEQLVQKQLTKEGIKLKRYNLFDKHSYNPTLDEQWEWGLASEFELMKSVSFDGAISTALTKKWDEVKPRIATVTEDYQIIYTNPIKLKTGETIKIEKRETNPEWQGWVFCTDTRGIKGWVSERYLKESGNSAVVIKDYDATELAVELGENIKVYYKEFGWCWCKNKHGSKGWVPTKNLKF